jgi:flavin prenyltransferase
MGIQAKGQYWQNRITLALTGASGFAYGKRLLECLLAADYQVYLLISEAARAVAECEQGLQLEVSEQALALQLGGEVASKGQLQICTSKDWMSPVASGSGAPKAMVICPCSGGTLSAIAHGASNNLIERAADVAIKERNQLIIVTREMPVSAIHLENMLTLARLGVTVMPASPGFYQQPQSINDLVDFVVARILDQLAIDQTLTPRWGVDT